jgi:hypothetical protein
VTTQIFIFHGTDFGWVSRALTISWPRPWTMRWSGP